MSQNDRSVPRRLLASGFTRHDGRGRDRAMPPILHYGFRPFFLLGAVHAGLAIPLWLAMYFHGVALAGPFSPLAWHVHEMLFGYLLAVLTGFVLTAIPNWTGRLPLSGWPLLLLIILWLAGRVAVATVPDPWLAMGIDLAFPALLSLAVWREVRAGNNWRNAPVAVLLTLFTLANAGHHAAGLVPALEGYGVRLALAVAALMIALIGGRIVPSFTRNWLAKAGRKRPPVPFAALDRLALAVTVIALGNWIFRPEAALTGGMLIGAGLLVLVRLLRWRGWLAWREPMLIVLHLGYGWLGLALLLLGAGRFIAALPASMAVHALTAGAVGTMTLAVMSRASLGHTGRPIAADAATLILYAVVTIGAALRVLAPLLEEGSAAALIAGGALWSAAFLIFALSYGPKLFAARIDHRAGR
ncbi:NnrS family protein [Pseudohoeflea coraliihabitans]|uniref:NnrS family protein n=1 Tax=Pseudohoeflea coraliihabitans TaxID=2860393 RepID=A0ABS6WQP6_9HYPH|nr:NnrS family protein [Pseudohoeflea sp. DP4N28-3]MBW3098289.1 NnrS family protein [Pseudohoeflea sp. DP4N28-3]